MGGYCIQESGEYVYVSLSTDLVQTSIIIKWCSIVFVLLDVEVNCYFPRPTTDYKTQYQFN